MCRDSGHLLRKRQQEAAQASSVHPALCTSGPVSVCPSYSKPHARCPVTRPGASWRFSHRQAPCLPHSKEPNAAVMLRGSAALALARDTEILASRRLDKHALLFMPWWFLWVLVPLGFVSKLFLFSSQSFWIIPARPAGFSDRKP